MSSRKIPLLLCVAAGVAVGFVVYYATRSSAPGAVAEQKSCGESSRKKRSKDSKGKCNRKSKKSSVVAPVEAPEPTPEAAPPPAEPAAADAGAPAAPVESAPAPAASDANRYVVASSYLPVMGEGGAAPPSPARSAPPPGAPSTLGNSAYMPVN